MTDERLKEALQRGMKAGTFGADARRAVWRRVEREKRPVKRKVTVGVVWAAALMLALCVTALAVASRYGVLDYVGAFDTYQKEASRVAEGLQSDLGSAQAGPFTIAVREAYYDGSMLLVAVDFTPDEEHAMVLGCDFEFEEDRYAWLVGDESYGDKRGIDVYREEGFQKLYVVDVHAYDMDEETQDIGFDYRFDGSGTLTVCYRISTQGRKEAMRLGLSGIIVENTSPGTEENEVIWHEADCEFDIRVSEQNTD